MRYAPVRTPSKTSTQRQNHDRTRDGGDPFYHDRDFDTSTDEQAVVIGSLDLSGVIAVAHSFSSTEIVRDLARRGSDRRNVLFALSLGASA
jgi:hypothetical protein